MHACARARACVCACVRVRAGECIYVCIFRWYGRVYTYNHGMSCMSLLSFAHVCMLTAFRDTSLLQSVVNKESQSDQDL